MNEWDGWGFNGTLARVPFTGRRFDHRPGFYVRTLSGLTGGGRVTVRGSASRAGTLRTPGVRDTAREITMSGFAYAPTPSILAAQIRQFEGILADESAFGLFAWEDLNQNRRVWVQREGIPTIDRRGMSGFADFRLSLSAPDQRVSGDTLQTSGWGSTVEVVNRGTYPAPIEIEIRGTRPTGYDIAGPAGRRVAVTRALAVGAPHLYDADTGVFSVGGVVDPDGVGRADQLEIPRGSHTITVSAGAEINVRGFDTYAP